MHTPAVMIVSLGDADQAHLLQLQLDHLGVASDVRLLHDNAALAAVLNDARQSPPVVIVISDEPLPQGAKQFDGQLVITTAPQAGRMATAQSIMNAGASAFLAPEDAPRGTAAALFLYAFLHALLADGDDIEDAMELAHSKVDAFTLYLG